MKFLSVLFFSFILQSFHQAHAVSHLKKTIEFFKDALEAHAKEEILKIGDCELSDIEIENDVKKGLKLSFQVKNSELYFSRRIELSEDKKLSKGEVALFPTYVKNVHNENFEYYRNAQYTGKMLRQLWPIKLEERIIQLKSEMIFVDHYKLDDQINKLHWHINKLELEINSSWFGMEKSVQKISCIELPKDEEQSE